MRIAKICDPEAREPYPSFTHNTTTYVGIPHARPSQLFVSNDEEPCSVAILADGREVHVQQLADGHALMELSQFKAPSIPPSSFVDTLASFVGMMGGRRGCKDTRLYAFQVVLHSNEPDRRVLSTYDFHLLCPQEYEAAQAYHREICHSPTAIAPDTISERAEGRCCPDCRQTRQSRS